MGEVREWGEQGEEEDVDGSAYHACCFWSAQRLASFANVARWSSQHQSASCWRRNLAVCCSWYEILVPLEASLEHVDPSQSLCYETRPENWNERGRELVGDEAQEEGSSQRGSWLRRRTHSCTDPAESSPVFRERRREEEQPALDDEVLASRDLVSLSFLPLASTR